MIFRIACSALLLGIPLAAQGAVPNLRTTESVSTLLGGSLLIDVAGVPGRPYAVLADPVPGPVTVFGTELVLGLSPSHFTLLAGTSPPFGAARVAVPVPSGAGLTGVALYSQALEVDAGAPNGMFRASNGESTVFHGGRAAIVERFDAAWAEGFAGNYDAATLGVLRGGDVRVRTHRTVDLRQGVTFDQGLATPLGHDGVRAQLVFRPRDVGATGDEELVTAIRWRLFGSTLRADSFAQLEIRAGHTAVAPDYTVGSFTALPLYPQSGLDPVFAQNYVNNRPPQTVYSGPYSIRPAALRGDGYVDYPTPQTPFTYDGVSSLLLELRVPPSAMPMRNLNGQIVRLMVLSSPLPGARNVAFGMPGAPVDPATVTTGRPDNAMYDYQIEFTRISTRAVSPWRAGAPGADYRRPILAASVPSGTSIEVEYRGSNNPSGANPTAWSSSVDVADGRAFVQYRFRFLADHATGAVPSVDTLVIPYLSSEGYSTRTSSLSKSASFVRSPR